MSTTASATKFKSPNANHLRPPSWRWDRVAALMSRRPTPGRCSRHDDPIVRAARKFVGRFERTKDDEAAKASLWFETPDLFYAFEFFDRAHESPKASMYLQARILAGQSFETIADLMGITPGTVKFYAALFFDVADRLHQRDWITEQVLIPALLRTPATGTHAQFQSNEIVQPFLDGSLLMLAYFGGPHMVDVLLSGFQPGSPATSPDDVGGWLERQWALTVRKRSAQAGMLFEINNLNVTELFAIHAKIIELNRAVKAGETAQPEWEKAVKAVLDQIPFSTGNDRARSHLETMLPRLDAESAELSDDELLHVAAGRPVPMHV
jgi:hypothetical protein